MEKLIFIILMVLMMGWILFIFFKRSKNKQLYNTKIPEAEKWAKILYYGGSRRDAGRSYLKLSDGRVFSVWGSALPLTLTFKIKQSQGGVLEGTYKPSFSAVSELKIDNSIFQFNSDKSQKSIKYNECIYNIQINLPGNQVTFNYNQQVNNTLWSDQVNKNGDVFAVINRITDNYTEVLFKSSQVSTEELFLLSFMVMSEKLVPGT